MNNNTQTVEVDSLDNYVLAIIMSPVDPSSVYAYKLLEHVSPGKYEVRFNKISKRPAYISKDEKFYYTDDRNSIYGGKRIAELYLEGKIEPLDPNSDYWGKIKNEIC